MDKFDHFSLAESLDWRDYGLLDSGNGLKFEKFGQYTFVRPEVQAMWNPALEKSDWSKADAVFESTSEESGGHWVFRNKIPGRWQMSYPLKITATSNLSADENRITKPNTSANLKFWAMTTPGRHLGVFPETASHWDFISDSLQATGKSAKVLNLFGYTGVASLAAAMVGAQVTHVDASRKSVNWARENQTLSGLEDKPIRWIVEDALKFVQREGRRGATYDGIILDPPKFGRGPKGEVWEVYKSLPDLLTACRAILSSTPIFVIVSIYAIKASAVHIGQTLQGVMGDFRGTIDNGELVTREVCRQVAVAGSIRSLAA